MKLLVSAAALVLSACSQQSLQGSLTAVLDLSYLNADLAVANDQASLRFLRPVPRDVPDAGVGAEDLVLKVVTTLSGHAVDPRYVFYLDDRLANGAQRGQVSRLVFNEAPPAFPEILRGQFYVRDVVQPNSYTSGYFTVTFVEGIEVANGRTVYGSFKAKVL